jgi:hypothetical protein
MGNLLPRILNDNTASFFDQHLKNIEPSLLDGPSLDMPEVRFSCVGGDSAI